MCKMKKKNVIKISFAFVVALLFYEINSLKKIYSEKRKNRLPLKKENGYFSTAREIDNAFVKKIEKRMKQRRETLQKTCKKMGLGSSAEKHKVELITSEKYKLVYCPVAKTGCSNMKRVMLGLNGFGNKTENIFPKNVVGQTNLLHQTVAQNFTIRSNGFPEFVEKQNYTRFIVVRHPFERALSAYKNKLTKQWNAKVPQFEKRARLIREKYGSEDRRNATGEIPTFTEFIDYVYDANNTNINGEDNHWNSVRVICHPCQNDFDVIAKIETIEEDLKYLLILLGAPIDLGMPRGYSKTGKSKTNIYTDPSFENIRKEQLNKLFDVFKLDFEMFGYQM